MTIFIVKIRALEVLRHKGRKMSEILEEQQKSDGGSSSGGGLRYPNAVVLWVQCEQVKWSVQNVFLLKQSLILGDIR